MAVKAKGARFFLWDSSLATPALVEIGEIVVVRPPHPTRDTIDTTHHGSVGDYREFISSLIDAGEVGLTVHWLPGGAGDVLMLAAFAAGDVRTWKIGVNGPSGARQITGSGLVIEYGPDELPIDDKQTATFTLKVTGPIVGAVFAP